CLEEDCEILVLFKILQIWKKQIVKNRLLLDLRMFRIQLTNLTRERTLLKDLYELNSVKRVKVARNSLGQPIGLETRLLAGYLGIITRNANLLPINYESWHHMPDSNKNQALDNIKERFALEVLDNYVKKTLGKNGETI
ncbi:hypothetical protein Gotur_028931, partial [Gossypium turneri]